MLMYVYIFNQNKYFYVIDVTLNVFLQFRQCIENSFSGEKKKKTIVLIHFIFNTGV